MGDDSSEPGGGGDGLIVGLFESIDGLFVIFLIDIFGYHHLPRLLV